MTCLAGFKTRLSNEHNVKEQENYMQRVIRVCACVIDEILSKSDCCKLRILSNAATAEV